MSKGGESAVRRLRFLAEICRSECRGWSTRLEVIGRGGTEWRSRRFGRLRPAELLSPPAEDGVEGLGHDGRGARAAVSAGVGGMIARSALRVRHGQSPRGKSKDLPIPFPSFSPQDLSVSNSTHNAGSDNACYVSFCTHGGHFFSYHCE